MCNEVLDGVFKACEATCPGDFLKHICDHPEAFGPQPDEYNTIEIFVQKKQSPAEIERALHGMCIEYIFFELRKSTQTFFSKSTVLIL